jgi:hypothetical protein
MPAPPPDSQYGIWLRDQGEWFSLGNFLPDSAGKGELKFSDPEGVDLLALYDTVDITIEPKPDTNLDPSGLVAYSFTFSPESLTHLRYLLASFPNTPKKTALVQGLYADVQNLDELAKDMKSAVASGDKASALQKGEEALILLAGSKSEDRKDWDGNGKIAVPSDPYGLLPNGDSFGYIQAVGGETDYTVGITSATQFMLDNGEVVKACVQNLTTWAPQLRGLLLTILTSKSDSEISKGIDDLVALTGQILNGIDVDNNGKVDTVPGECGAKSVYEFAYYMADMPISPVSISYQLTAVAAATSSPISAAPTHAHQDSQQNTPSGNNNNPGNNNQNQSKPTKKPHPTDKPKGNTKP